ncbi:hypothetical protein ABGB14_37490 [Nonomuraea sp. B10E15]|uniref:hypothetical protein n=1 Tax=Nonomuraea sp. B10E15 TaxID=3153560 RepID=UPI00325D157C
MRTVVLAGCVMNIVTLAWESRLVLLAVGPMRRSEGRVRRHAGGRSEVLAGVLTACTLVCFALLPRPP